MNLQEIKSIIDETFQIPSVDSQIEGDLGKIRGYGYIECNAGEGLKDEDGNPQKNQTDIAFEATEDYIQVNELGFQIPIIEGDDRYALQEVKACTTKNNELLKRAEGRLDYNGPHTESHITHMFDNGNFRKWIVNPQYIRKYDSYEDMAADMRDTICGIANDYGVQSCLRSRRTAF